MNALALKGAARMAAAVPLLALFLAPAAAACREDLLASQQKLATTRAGIQKVAAASDAQKCPAYRRHYGAMLEVRKVFAQCDTGAQGPEQIAQLDGLIEAFRKRLPSGCKP
jgi:hypothetical protein